MAAARNKQTSARYSMGFPPQSLQFDLRKPVPAWHPDPDVATFLDRIPFGGLRGEIVIQVPQFKPYFKEPFVLKIPDTTPEWTTRDVLSEMQKQFMSEIRPDHQEILDAIGPVHDARAERLGTATPPGPYRFVDIFCEEMVFDGLMVITFNVFTLKTRSLRSRRNEALWHY